MRYEDVTALIEEATATQEVAVGIRAYSDGRTLPVALGVGRAGDSFRLAIFSSDPVVADQLVARAAGEADVYLIPTVSPRVTSSWAQQPHDIIGIGRQVGPVGLGWVGTGGIVVRSAEDAKVLLHVTNEHVTGERAPRGRVMHQGGRSYGVVWRTGGLSFTVSNRYDVGTVAIDRTRRVNATYEHGIDDNLRGIRRMTPDDVGRRFTNTGQTRGTMFGSCVAVDVRDLAVGYNGGVARFVDQAAFLGENGKPFSVGGHSGSTIVCVDDRHAVALLFAGGRDATGRDLTFAAADLPGAITAGGGIPELLA
jgi:hypothetical protein